MSKILKSVTLGDVKNGGIFRALGKEFVKLDPWNRRSVPGVLQSVPRNDGSFL